MATIRATATMKVTAMARPLTACTVTILTTPTRARPMATMGLAGSPVASSLAPVRGSEAVMAGTGAAEVTTADVAITADVVITTDAATTEAMATAARPIGPVLLLADTPDVARSGAASTASAEAAQLAAAEGALAEARSTVVAEAAFTEAAVREVVAEAMAADAGNFGA
jgi:hypothetical protein